jgi:hypothetical protein
VAFPERRFALVVVAGIFALNDGRFGDDVAGMERAIGRGVIDAWAP